MKKLLLAAAMLPSLSFATPIDSVSAVLAGDPRSDAPDGIGVQVTGVQDGALQDFFDFTVDWTPLSASIHPNARMFELYISLNPDDAAQWEISGTTAGWTSSEVVSVNGAGNTVQAGFLFEFDNDNPPEPLPLEFTLQYLLGDITAENFVDAPDWISSDTDLLEVQVGARVGGLTSDATTCPSGDCDGYGTADGGSGFAGADWVADPVDADAPGIAALLSMGLIGLFLDRRRRK